MNTSKSLKKILKKTVSVLDESKKDIFAIAESSRQEYEKIRKELETVKEETNQVIDAVDDLETVNRKARLRLMEVSKDFYNYTEKDIQNAYEKAQETSVEIAVLKEKEEQLKEKRNYLEKRLIKIKKNVERAENLVSRVSIIRQFLIGEMDSLNNHFDDIKQKDNLAIKVIQAQEEERGRLAREIHDGPAQSIANLVFRVELSEKLLDKDIAKARKELKELKRLIRMSMQEVRKIIYNLRPMSLDDIGLVPTLKQYINNFAKQTEIFIDFVVQGSQKRLSNTYEVTIFRLVQEALNNIYKHAEASTGKVRLEYSKNKINIFIKDDGVGFKNNEVDIDKYGLISMKERCKLLGGQITIDSELNRGTIIKILLPLKRSEANNDD